MNDPVVVVDYDPAWPAAYQAERAKIARALGDRALAIEHYGSTAVPGLAAKPIVDVMVAVVELRDAGEEIASLVAAGYERRPSGDLERPRRLFLVRYEGDRRVAHLALVEPAADYWTEHLAFRDALRADSGLACRYAALKRELAARHRNDRIAYTEAKSHFVTAALRSLASPE